MILQPSTIILNSYTSREPITLQALLNAKEKVESKGIPPNIMRVSPKTFQDINIYFQNKEMEEVIKAGVIKSQGPPALMSIEVWIDHDLKPGEWKFEHINKVQTTRGSNENWKV